MESDLERYRKQMLFAGIGEAGQHHLQSARVLVCGCGALGTVLADAMVRAGVGLVRIVDRDFVETSNLQRQILFDERDVAARSPKAIAAAEKLRFVNSQIEIQAEVADIDCDNILELAADVDLILDGTDNFEVRFLINDAALELGTPWIYAGCIGSHGQSMPVFPGQSACLRCLLGHPPEAGSTETCDTAGVLGPAISVIASLEAVNALKILSGQPQLVKRVLTVVDVWDGTFREMNVGSLRDQSHCPACHDGERLWLHGEAGAQTVILCGRNSVQVAPRQKQAISLEELAARLQHSGTVEVNRYLLRFQLAEPQLDLTVFKDGRAIIQGTEDITLARGIYSRYIGL